ncbi:hypothetical protein CHS0354_038877 [Potamilus streckersoni]|uniref:MYND-type domain-containing protein n=1 Tax=Potamilus streckersoni TaxID=2493646 RepID=A0AAE0VTP8_9BIVA|nr:hypothetical protein CHS0354_038877 [Potamilus streckersoni]
MKSARKGELIFEERPFTHVLDHSQQGQRCHSCLERSEHLKKCTACGLLRYCSLACQRCDWPIHRRECPCLKQVAPNVPLDSVRLMLRILIKTQLLEKEDQSTTETVWRRTFHDLMSHIEEIQVDPSRSQQFAQIVYTLRELCQGQLDLPPVTQLMEVFGKVTINSFTICDGDLQAVGVGLYLGASYLDHSCQPNAVVSFQGQKLMVRALRDIPEVKPSNIFISYTDQLAITEDRQRQLKEQYYFSCQCCRCQDISLDRLLKSFVCPVPTCTGAVCRIQVGELLPCGSCGMNSYEESYRRKVEDTFHHLIQDLQQIEQAKKAKDLDKVLSLCQKCLNPDTVMVLHSNNLLHIQALDRGLDVAIDLGLWEQALKYGLQLIPLYIKVYPSGSPQVGLLLLKVGKLELYLQRLECALQHLQQGESIIRVTHGRFHELYCQLSELIDQCTDELRVHMEHS